MRVQSVQCDVITLKKVTKVLNVMCGSVRASRPLLRTCILQAIFQIGTNPVKY